MGVATRTEMKRFLKSAGLVFAILFVPVLVFVRYMEATNRFDALGWWYSIYGTLAFSIPTALLFAGVHFILAKNRGGGSI